MKRYPFHAAALGLLPLFLLISAPWLLAADAATRLPSIDRRLESKPGTPQLTGERAEALHTLQARIPGVRVDLHPIIGSPVWIHNRDGFLTGPDSEDEILHPLVAGESPSQTADPHWRIKAFLNENSALFSHGAEALANARITRKYVTPHNGLRTVVWEQELDGIPVFEGLLCAHITKNGELVSLSSQFVPHPAAAADTG